jgi:hypothetical protein
MMVGTSEPRLKDALVWHLGWFSFYAALLLGGFGIIFNIEARPYQIYLVIAWIFLVSADILFIGGKDKKTNIYRCLFFLPGQSF